MNVYTGPQSRERALAFLAMVEGDADVTITLAGVEDSRRNLEAFHRLSTCVASCGCTGFEPRADCPDPACFCNGAS